jgi:hypothetical protein
MAEAEALAVMGALGALVALAPMLRLKVPQ